MSGVLDGVLDMTVLDVPVDDPMVGDGASVDDKTSVEDENIVGDADETSEKVLLECL